MGDIHPVSRERHGHLSWNRAAGFGWARKEQSVAVSLREAPQLLTALPLAFVRHQDHFLFTVVLGFRPNENLVVAQDGSWKVQPVPSALQHYPFRRLRNADGLDVLGIDEDALLPLGAAEGVPFFDALGNPAPELTPLLERLVQSERERVQANRIAAILDQHGLLEPWDLTLQDERQGMTKIEGLYRIKEPTLGELPGDVLVTLRNSGALLMAYCQLLSMQHIHQLGRMFSMPAAPPPNTAGLDDHGILSFANL